MGIGAMIGGSLISGVMGARSANRAADAQVEAADRATELQREIYYNDIERAQPFYNSGVNALAAYNYELGLGPDPRTTQQIVTINGDTQPGGMQGGTQVQAPNPIGNPFVMRPQARNTALDYARGDDNVGRAPMPAAMPQAQPTSYMVGGQSYDTLEAAQAAANAGQNYRGFQETPGFQYALQQSQDAIDRAAAARGMRFSGATVNALATDAQGRQNQEYNNWLNRVGGLAGQGVQVTGQMANLGQNFGAAAGQNALAAGNARASGYMGQNNAFQGTMGNLANIYGMANSGMFGSGGGGFNPFGGWWS